MILFDNACLSDSVVHSSFALVTSNVCCLARSGPFDNGSSHYCLDGIAPTESCQYLSDNRHIFVVFGDSQPVLC